MTCEDLVAQCFLDEQAPLAVPELNRERTLKYLQCCGTVNLTLLLVLCRVSARSGLRIINDLDVLGGELKTAKTISTWLS